MRLPLLFVLAAAVSLHAQTTVGPYSCGSATTSPLQCNGAPVGPWHTDTMGNSVPFGALWLHDYLTGIGPDYIVWQGGYENVAEALISESTCVITAKITSAGHTAMQCTHLHVKFAGGDPAIASNYTGDGNFYFSYRYAGYGRTARWFRYLTSGAVALKYY